MGALGEMASAVAHGVRNPLSSIRSSAELWQNTPGAPCVESAADPRECRAVLQGLNNVVANALEAIPPQGGSVGIAPQNLEKIYQPSVGSKIEPDKPPTHDHAAPLFCI